MLGFAGRSAVGSAQLAAASLRPFVVGRDAREREGSGSTGGGPIAGGITCRSTATGRSTAACGSLRPKPPDSRSGAIWAGRGPSCRSMPPRSCSGASKPMSRNSARCRRRASGLQDSPAGPGPGRGSRDPSRGARGRGRRLSADVRSGSAYSFDQALRLGRALEEMGYLWLEEPLPDESFPALRELTRQLDLPVVGGEVLAKHPWSLAECVATRSSMRCARMSAGRGASPGS